MTVIGNSNTAITLAAASPNVTITGNVTGYGPVGYDAGHIVFAAVQGREPTAFNILNTGNIETYPQDTYNAGSFDAGIFLGAPGEVTNQGIIGGNAGLLIFGYAAGAYVKNSGLIQGRAGNGVGITGFSGVSNTGTIAGSQIGLYLESGGDISNTGTISGPTAIFAIGADNIGNSGEILAAGTAGVVADGTLSNFATGFISAAGTAIVTPIGGDITNNGTIAGATGIWFIDSGSLDNTGQISGSYEAITATEFSSFTTSLYNAGGARITGGKYGLDINGVTGAYTSIGNAGYIEAAAGNATRNAGTRQGSYGASGTALLFQQGRVTNTGTINGGGTAVFAAYGAGTITNTGLIEAAAVGVELAAGGTITNAGLITGNALGISLAAAAYLGNSGIIDGGIAAAPAAGIDIENLGAGLINGGITATAGIIANSGTITGGIQIAPGGNATIFNAGTIAGTGGGNAGYGAYLAGNATLLNSGLIEGAAAGIYVAAGGTIFDTGTIAGLAGAPALVFAAGSTNLLILDPGAVLTGAVTLNGALILGAAAAAGALNLSTIKNLDAVAIDPGAVWNLSGTLSRGASVFNDGTIKTGAPGIALPKSGAVYNYGLIKGGGGISITAGGYVYNAGIIKTRTTGAAGIALSGPGYIVNAAGAAITATASHAAGISLATLDAVYNYGAITAGPGADGVTATGIAAIYNYAGGSITGVTGIQLANGIVYDAGAITGTNAAIDFTAAGPNQLVLTPTATITGGVDLNGGTIALDPGAKRGTLALAQFTAATALSIAAAARWQLDTATPETLAITNNGVLFAPAATIAAAITGTGALDITSSLTLTGAVARTQKIDFTGTAETLALGNTVAFAATIKSFAIGDTIDLTNLPFASITGETFAAGTLTLDLATTALTLTFASPATFGTETFALAAEGGGGAAGSGTAITLSPTPKMQFLTTPSASTDHSGEGGGGLGSGNLPTLTGTTAPTPGWTPIPLTPTAWLRPEITSTLALALPQITLS